METKRKAELIKKILANCANRPIGEADSVAIAKAILGNPVRLGSALYQCGKGRRYLHLIRMPVREKDLN